jgi:hypothetical protein
MPAGAAPISTTMVATTISIERRARARRGRVAVAITIAAACAILGGCGTPAVIKPSSTPLPGLERDIHAAQNAVAQTEREAQSDASSNPGSP